MSGGGGSGGFYKYRCKNFLSHNCDNWVWVNGASCSNCQAQGRGIGLQMASDLQERSLEIYVPQDDDGLLPYGILKIFLDDQNGGYQPHSLTAEGFPDTSDKGLSVRDDVELSGSHSTLP